MSELLKNALKKVELTYDDSIINKFDTYSTLLKEWNEKVNLTSIVEDNEIVLKHFIDSVICTRYFDFNSKSIIDVGTGAGFPGLPIKIMNESVKLTLLDSLQKRINFLETVCKETKINNVEMIHGRAEDFGKDKSYREKFDFAVSRAVASLPALAEYCLPFVKVGGKFICFKGPDPKEEILTSEKAIQSLGGEIDDSMGYILPDTDIMHTLIIIKKIQRTPTQFPRKAGTPLKNPIK